MCPCVRMPVPVLYKLGADANEEARDDGSLLMEFKDSRVVSVAGRRSMCRAWNLPDIHQRSDYYSYVKTYIHTQDGIPTARKLHSELASRPLC
jgi:hypothetical protein